MRHWTATLLLACFLAAGCGGGGGGGGDDGPVLDGWWELTSRAEGAAGPFDPVWFGYGSEAGTSFLYKSIAFDWDGATLWGDDELDTSADQVVYSLVLQPEGHFEGEHILLSSSADTVVREAVLRRAAPPTGTFTIQRTVGGDTREIRSTTAYAWVEVGGSGVGSTQYAASIHHTTPQNTEGMRMDVILPTPRFGPIDLDLAGSHTLWLLFSGETPWGATDGTLTINEFHADRIRGSFTATIHGLGPAGTAQGMFDVPVHWWR